jgi:predicted adenine nucleotide alpha hydrolase (AANH) superfamily ATPase
MDQYDVTFFYTNSNIYPESEYLQRLEEVRRFAAVCDVQLIEDVYDHEAWLTHIAGLEHEPEKGKRCVKCFEFNLGRTAAYAQQNGFDYFTTTLSISPHKHSRTIFDIGTRLGNFLGIDFKKKDGFRHSVELSKKHDLYRQDYCGCEFSLQDRREKESV